MIWILGNNQMTVPALPNLNHHFEPGNHIAGQIKTTGMSIKPVERTDYRDQKLNLNHVITLAIVAKTGGAFLSHAIEVHGECLKELQDELMETSDSLERRSGWHHRNGTGDSLPF